VDCTIITCSLAFSVVSHRDDLVGLTRRHFEQTPVAVSFPIAATDWIVLQCALLVAEPLRFPIRVQFAGFSKRTRNPATIDAWTFKHENIIVSNVSLQTQLKTTILPSIFTFTFRFECFTYMDF